MATLTRLLLLFSITWITGLTAPLFSIGEWALSGHDLLMLGGGLFLIVKAIREMHEALEEGGAAAAPRQSASLIGAIVMIVLIDIVFSLDSIMAAVGMTKDLGIMIAAVVIGSVILLIASGLIMRVHQQPPDGEELLALAFVLLIGVKVLVG